jgi:hypothetical protein
VRNYYIQSNRKVICYTEQKERRPTGLVTSWLGAALKERSNGKQERKHKQLLDDLKEKWGYRKLKEEALDRIVYRTRFGRGFGPVVRQSA